MQGAVTDKPLVKVSKDEKLEAQGSSDSVDIAPLPPALEKALAQVISPPTATDKKDATYYKKKARANNTYRSYASAIKGTQQYTG